jgi:hypothetical protein
MVVDRRRSSDRLKSTDRLDQAGELTPDDSEAA